MRCTWVKQDVACTSEATHPQVGKDGSQWAHLCEEHDKKLNDAVGSGDVKKLMAAYIQAQGGAKAAAARMAPGAQKVVAGIVGALRGKVGQ